MFKGFVNFFNKNNQIEKYPQINQYIPPKKEPSKLKGKQIKDYSLEDKITSFDNPFSELVSGFKQNKIKVSIYAIEKKIVNQQFFVTYSNALSQNVDNIYPKYLQIVQSVNYIYLIFQQLKIPTQNVWNVKDLIDQIFNISCNIGSIINPNGLLINYQKKIVYLPPYQAINRMSKFQYDIKNKSLLADLFCKLTFVDQMDKKRQIKQTIINYKEKDLTQLKITILNILSPFSQQNQKRAFPFLKNSQQSNQSSKIFYNNQNRAIKIQQPHHSKSFLNYFMPSYNQDISDKSNKYQQNLNNVENQLYPSFTQDDIQIKQLLQVAKVNPQLFNQANQYFTLRESARARNQNKQQSKQINEIIDNTKNSLFQIKVIKSDHNKSKYLIRSNIKKKQENQFQMCLASYLQTFKHFKKTIKSSLRYYQKGYAGIFLAYFITLIVILRKSKLVYMLQNQDDIFDIGCKSTNVEKHVSRLKRDLLYQAKNLTDLRETIFRCFIPMKTMQIISPFLDDHIENVDQVKLQDFCFFYLTSLMKGKVQKNVHFINFIQFLYIILNRNFQIVHFQNQTPIFWDQQFFQLRKMLIKSILPKWNI